MGQALIGYAVSGREVRETLAVNVGFNQVHMSGLQPGQSIQSLHGQALGVLAWRAPEGHLDFKKFDTVWETLRGAAQWQARINAGQAQLASDMARDNQRTAQRITQIQGETGRQTIAEMAKRGDNAARTRAEISDMQMGSFRARDASTDSPGFDPDRDLGLPDELLKRTR